MGSGNKEDEMIDCKVHYLVMITGVAIATITNMHYLLKCPPR